MPAPLNLSTLIYGRNQVVHRDLSRKNEYGIRGGSTEKRVRSIRFRAGSRVLYLVISSALMVNSSLTLHTSLMPGGKLAEFDNLPLKAMIKAVCSGLRKTFVLDQGDLLIVSNHAALHRTLGMYLGVQWH